MYIIKRTVLSLVLLVFSLSCVSAADEEICERTLDLVVVIDGSNSLGQKNFYIMLTTIAESVEVLTFGANKARVGAVLFSTIVTAIVQLQSDKASFQQAVLNMEYPDESTFTHLGIAEATKMLIAARRKDVPIAIMLVTDGASWDRDSTAYEALYASSRGIDIWAVGVSENADMVELAKIATNGTRQAFKIEDFELIPDRLINLTRIVCIQTETLSTFTPPTTTTTTPPTTSTASTTTTTTTPTTTTTTTPSTSTSTTTTTTTPRTTTPTTTTPTTTTTTTPTTTTTTPTTTTTTPTTTTTTTITTTMSTTSAPPQGENPNPYTELCKNSPSIGGVGYVLYPGDCTKVLQCYYNPYTNQTLVVTRQCPSGQFWDQSCLKCVSSWKVDCPYDKCKPCNNNSNMCAASVNSYPMDGICGGYWECVNGRSNPKCCPPCYTYMAGYGCVFGSKCFDKCGPQESCDDGLGVCEKIPVWENVTDYSIATDSAGLQSTTCSRADFSILECKCRLKITDMFMWNDANCRAYHEADVQELCSWGTTDIPIKKLASTGPLTFRIQVNTSVPNFEIISVNSSEPCSNASTLRVWADQAGIHASVGDPNKDGAQANVLFKNITGEMEIIVVLHQGKLTLAASQDSFQLVSTVKATTASLCTDCVHMFSVTSTANTDECVLNKVQLYNCKPEITTIYE